MTATTPFAWHRRIASTTVMSVLRNLAHKGLLEQDKAQAAHVYRAKVTDEEVAGGILATLLDKIMGGRREPLIAHLRQSADGRPEGRHCGHHASRVELDS